MEMAQQAERTLDVQYFVIENDDTGKLIQEALLQAADRGVRVRVLLDDEGSRGRTVKLTPLAAHPNIELRVFNPAVYRGQVEFLEFLHNVELLGDAIRLNRRMHNKLFVVDNEIGIIGGRNIGDAYFQEGRDLDFGDYDVIAAGRVVKDMLDVQLPLSQTELGRAALPQDVGRVTPRACLQGWLFYPLATGSTAPIAGVSPAHWRGWWCRSDDWRRHGAPWTELAGA